MLSCQIKEDRIQHMLTSQYRGSWGKHRGWEEDSGEQAGRVDKGGGGTAQGYINGCRITAIWRSWWEPQGCWWSHVTESIACCTWESAPAKLPASGRQVVQCLLVLAPQKPGIGKKSWEYSETCYLHKTMLCLRLQLWEVEDSSRTLHRWRRSVQICAGGDGRTADWAPPNGWHDVSEEAGIYDNFLLSNKIQLPEVQWAVPFISLFI